MPEDLDGSPIDLFYSYAHEDEGLREELDGHLALLKRRGVLRTWHDRRITAGDEWRDAIDAHLASADIILFLVSSDFLSSDYINDREMKTALARHEAGEATVIPVIARPVDWEGAEFSGLQGLPTDMKPVTTWPNRDEAWTDVAKGIRRAVGRVLAARPREDRPAPPPSIPAAAPSRPAVPGYVAAAEHRVFSAFREHVSSAYAAKGVATPSDFDERSRRVGTQLADLRGQKRVLWVDDHPEGNRDEIAALLALQIDVKTCTTTDEALTLLGGSAEPFDLVISDWRRWSLTDIVEPEGLRLLRRMREAGIETPLIFYHGEFDPTKAEARRELARSTGAVGATSAPDVLLEDVGRILAAA